MSINKCVFPSAGFGTRFLPVTKVVPKELLPVGTSPLIEFSFNEAHDSNISEMLVIINKDKLLIRDYFNKNSTLDTYLFNHNKSHLLDRPYNLINSCKINYVEQKVMSGLGSAILLTQEIVKEEPFAVILPDDLCFSEDESVLAQMCKIHEKYPDKTIIAIEEVDDSRVSNYGIVSGRPFLNQSDIILVDKMVEKPTDKTEIDSNLAVIGRYILNNDIFEAISSSNMDKSGELQLTSGLLKLANQGKVLAYKFKGTRIDCGQFEGYLYANNFFQKINKQL